MVVSALHAIPDPTSLAQAIIDTVRTPLLVLDAKLCVLAASRSYYAAFGSDEESTHGRSLYDLTTAQWDVADLRGLLDTVIAGGATIEAYEIEILLPNVGTRTLLLDARKVYYAKEQDISILLGFEDVTALRVATREKDAALLQKTMLLQEMQHRIANSLQIIASILMLKARAVHSEETREHLKDAHRRVLSVAAAQAQLQPSIFGDAVDIGPYLTSLCDSLARSMIGDRLSVTLTVRADLGTTTSAEATSLGLIVTELVINALKYAFVGRNAPGQILVDYAVQPDGWILSVTDDGQGLQLDSAPVVGGLGSTLVAALAEQLEARIERSNTGPGLVVTITHDGEVFHRTPRLRPTAPAEATLS